VRLAGFFVFFSLNNGLFYNAATAITQPINCRRYNSKILFLSTAASGPDPSFCQTFPRGKSGEAAAEFGPKLPMLNLCGLSATNDFSVVKTCGKH